MLDMGECAKIDNAVPLSTMPAPSIGTAPLPLLRLILAVKTANPLIIKVTNKVAPRPMWIINK